MGAGRMAEVQLDDDPAPGAQTPRRAVAATRARRLLRRWWPVPVVAALAAAAWQAAADGRAEDRAELLRGTPGVLAETVTAPLEAAPWGTSDALGLLMSGTRTEDDLVAGVLVPGTGTPASVVALHPDTGDVAWQAEIGVLPDETGYTHAASCASGTPAPAANLWCTVIDGPASDAGPVMTRLVEVDLDARAVAGSRALPPHAEATVVRDTLVVATEQDGAVLLAGSDLVDGAERWRTEVPDAISPSFQSGWLVAPGDHVLVHGAAGTWAVDPDDGRVQAREDGLYVARGDGLVGIPSSGGMRVRLLGTDGAGTATVSGFPVHVSPDDGSAPSVQPVSATDGSGSVLRGVDTATGAVRWERGVESGPRSGYLLLDGVLYGSDLTTVWAVDAGTGAERWTTSAALAEGSELMTDGRHLLRAEREGDSGGLVLSAYALDTGRRAWTTPVPDGVERLWPWDGVLYGYSGDGREMFRLH